MEEQNGDVMNEDQLFYSMKDEVFVLKLASFENFEKFLQWLSMTEKHHAIAGFLEDTDGFDNSQSVNMAASLESVILKLLQNTTNEGQVQGFREIQDLCKDPSVVISLCQCITQSVDPHVRKYAALLLRRRLLKVKFWKKLTPEIKQGLKQTILEAYVKDSERIVRNALAELVAAIAKHELSDGKWPELMELLNQSIRSNSIIDREVGLYTLSVIAKTLGPKLKPHFKGLLSLFQKTLTDTSSADIPYFTICALTNMVCSIGTEELNLFQSLVPSIITIIRMLADDNQEKACECLEIFDELVECEVGVLAPHLRGLVEFCLETAKSDKYDDAIRIKAINIVAYLVRLKKKAIIKQKLAQPILEVFFPLMCRPCSGDIDCDEDDQLEEQSLPSASGQALDVMALHLPPSKLLPLLMQHLQGAFHHTNPHCRKGSFLAISVIAEGCSEFIRHKYLPVFVPVIIKGIKDEDAAVRNAALYAVGQYAEYLQPDISKYASELLPVLFEYLQQACLLLQQGSKNPPTLMRIFYAVEKFCENLENILPYLPTLMSCLTTFLTINVEKSVVKELAVEAIGSVAAAAKSDFIPYFSTVMGQLQSFISENNTDETRPLQIQAIDTLAIIARTVGRETFMPLAHECIKCGLHLMKEIDDPDIRRSCYGLFSSVSVVLKSDMNPYLNTIIERMLETLKSAEGISVSTITGDANTAFTLFEDGEDDEKENGAMSDENLEEADDDEDDDDITGYNVENAYIEEKEGACLALKEMADEIGPGFLPYLDVCFTEVRKLTEHLSDDVRRAAIGTLGQFCITLSDVIQETGNLECRVVLETNLAILFPKLFSQAREDTETSVVIACLETLQSIIDKIKSNALNASYLESICLLIKDVFKNKLACQDEEVNEEGDDDQEAEYDNLLLEYAGELIASLNKVVPYQQFGPYLAGLMPFLMAKCKKACTVSEKSFSIGTLADIVSSLEPGCVKPYITHLQPVFLSGMKEENEEVRSNSVYGLGVLAQNAQHLVFDQYPAYLNALSNMIATEDDNRSKDNICGTVARLIQTNVSGVPLENVFPVFIQYLPLKEDFEENATVFECLNYLHAIHHEQFFKNIPQILERSSETLLNDKVNEKTVALIHSLVKNIYSEFPTDFESVIKTLPPPKAEALMKVTIVA
ncbi:importin-4 [Trichonephila clavata]|uniref:Importin-4 n=1 Tax=Trichonephila clavata TaxID=2740835 RepID=A0A8X6F7M0_TRICU|nr:importin-4 [Trichonephila clavata]